MNKNSVTTVERKYAPVVLLLVIAIGISMLTRLLLLIAVPSNAGITAALIIKSFGIGVLYDLLVSLVLVMPLTIQITFTTNFIYAPKIRWITFGVFVLLFIIIFFTHLIPKDFDKGLYRVIIIYLLVRFTIIVFLSTRSIAFRNKWRSVVLQLIFLLSVFLLVFNAVSEWFFWNEFSSRYNFIAVDYLIYTNEVIGNIQQSYPLPLIISCVAVGAIALLLLTRKKIISSAHSGLFFLRRIAAMACIIAVIVLLGFIIKPQWKEFSKNNYSNELAGNGIYEFVQAFKNNNLDFYKYYTTLPDSIAFSIVKQKMQNNYSRFTNDSLFNIERQIQYPVPENKMNVVLVSVESLSASFLKAFGNTENITPNMDTLAEKGMLFTNLYSSGTRTVKGLEALSLSIPPPPGQSMVKRPNNENMFSLGAVFRSKGYATQYIYGGYGYFDNMNYFFGNNGYDVVDREALQPNEIHYANIWGVADEDLFTLALREMDSNYNAGKPFFSHVMTVSNHRPFTYPDNRIDIPPTAQSREGAVKYTDYSIGKFLKEASQKPWFSNTLFIIVADHCASSAGKQALPVTGYHIPMIIHSPGNIEAKHVTSLTAQIDIAPTILGLLHFSYTSKFFGQDIFNISPDQQKAFISTYQGLGFLKHDTLIVQSPVKQLKTYLPDFTTGDAKEINGNDSLTNEAIAYYQVISWMIKHNKYRFP